jgi:hypothetical protein
VQLSTRPVGTAGWRGPPKAMLSNCRWVLLREPESLLSNGFHT